MGTFLREPVDFARHNAEVEAVWAAYRAGAPVRVPLAVSGSITNYFFNPQLNTRGLTFEQFFTDARVQIDAQLHYQAWQRHHLVCDRPMGDPEAWQLSVDFQNSFDASWAGGPLRYQGRFLPDTEPILDKDKEKLYDLPDPLPLDGGVVGRGIAFYDEMTDYCRDHTFRGKPIRPPQTLCGEGTDGVLDLAYKLRGAENLLVDLYEDEQYFHDLLSWITRSLIHRMKALRALRWQKNPAAADAGQMRRAGFFLADDAMALISEKTYREHLLPYHRQLVEAFSDGRDIGFHLCGDAMRHFPVLTQALGVRTLDTGFPVDHGRLRRMVGEDVTINGGPTVMLIKDGPEAALRAEARRILGSGVTQGGRFIMIAANNMAPLTPVEHVQALYDEVKRSGRYPIGEGGA